MFKHLYSLGGDLYKQQLEKSENKERVIQDYQKKLRRNINPKNLRRYVETFLKYAFIMFTYIVPFLLLRAQTLSNREISLYLYVNSKKTKKKEEEKEKSPSFQGN